MTTVLRAHWRGEENVLFAVMRQDDEYTRYIEDLEREHRELYGPPARSSMRRPCQDGW
ncbi:hypothetical protein [Streptomyces sp. NBC_00623]